MHATAAKPSIDTTLENLQVAFNGEANAAARYAEFARKADEEGFHKAASLFRAAGYAEQIHAANHAAIINKMGGSPELRIDKPVVRSTVENLKAAIAGEEYERDFMYPGFIKEAEAESNTAAVRTFTHALKAEAEHARLYRSALAHLDAMKTIATYYVCPTCGYIAEKRSFERCPVCRLPRERFEAVS